VVLLVFYTRGYSLRYGEDSMRVYHDRSEADADSHWRGSAATETAMLRMPRPWVRQYASAVGGGPC
jgi:hypothetical protein